MTKKLSKQRRWQLRQVELGKCITCGKEAFKGNYCFEHYNQREIYAERRQLRLKGLEEENHYLKSVILLYEETEFDHKKLVRELDVIINGENAAEQASLVDIVCQLRRSKGLI